MTVIAWIRRSLREHDNTALVEASKEYDEVVPFYVIDEEYFEREKLGYPRVKFWREALENFRKQLKNDGKDLVVRKGKPVEQLEKIVEETNAEAIYFNRDYSPYSKKRDSEVWEMDVEVRDFKDVVMFEKQEITTNSGDPYKVYSYYRDKWFEKEKKKPGEVEDYEVPEVESDNIPSLEELGFEEPDDFNWIWKPTRQGALERIEEFSQRIGEYDDKRDYPAEDATSKLSPHLKFGTVSIREVFWKAEQRRENADEDEKEGITTWQEELAWRDFYFQVMWNYPYCVEEPFLEEYEAINWEEDEEKWQRFIEGKTGFPFVDAGMRQLEKEGWMHNRLRMVVASFCAKDLHLDWKLLYDYFEKNFVDAETASMIGGIQWAYSIGTDAQPYFRVFNPWTQGEKYDPDGEYIRQYVPELEDVPDEYIHRPQEMPEEIQKETGCIIGEDYPEPVVDHDEERKKAVEKFEQVKSD